MTIRSRIVSQFARPRGVIGYLAGMVMANRGSNLKRNRWTIGLLNIKEDNQMLELGCGPGIGLKAAAAKLKTGTVTGLDHSTIMLAQAWQRLKSEIEAGKCILQPGNVDWLKKRPNTYERIYSANVVQFLPDMETAFQTMFKSLKPNGIIATTYQPRHKNPSRDDALEMSAKIADAMKTAGFIDIKIAELSLALAPAICVTGTVPVLKLKNPNSTPKLTR